MPPRGWSVGRAGGQGKHPDARVSVTDRAGAICAPKVWRPRTASAFGLQAVASARLGSVQVPRAKQPEQAKGTARLRLGYTYYRFVASTHIIRRRKASLEKKNESICID